MTNIVKDSIPGLTIELMDDEIGDGMILLEHDSDGNLDRIAIHPIHLRYMVKKYGLIASDPTTAKHIATLERRLLVLSGRIGHLADYLTNHTDHEHADLSYEQTYATATADIAAEFVAELDDVLTITEPPERAPERVKPSVGTRPRQLSIKA